MSALRERFVSVGSWSTHCFNFTHELPASPTLQLARGGRQDRFFPSSCVIPAFANEPWWAILFQVDTDIEVSSRQGQDIREQTDGNLNNYVPTTGTRNPYRPWLIAKIIPPICALLPFAEGDLGSPFGSPAASSSSAPLQRSRINHSVLSLCYSRLLRQTFARFIS